MSPIIQNVDGKSAESKVFLASSRERRVVTNMKLHKEIFFKEFFELKNQEERAFKTWR